MQSSYHYLILVWQNLILRAKVLLFVVFETTPLSRRQQRKKAKTAFSVRACVHPGLIVVMWAYWRCFFSSLKSSTEWFQRPTCHLDNQSMDICALMDTVAVLSNELSSLRSVFDKFSLGSLEISCQENQVQSSMPEIRAKTSSHSSASSHSSQVISPNYRKFNVVLSDLEEYPRGSLGHEKLLLTWQGLKMCFYCGQFYLWPIYQRLLSSRENQGKHDSSSSSPRLVQLNCWCVPIAV